MFAFKAGYICRNYKSILSDMYDACVKVLRVPKKKMALKDMAE